MFLDEILHQLEWIKRPDWQPIGVFFCGLRASTLFEQAPGARMGVQGNQREKDLLGSCFFLTGS